MAEGGLKFMREVPYFVQVGWGSVIADYSMYISAFYSNKFKTGQNPRDYFFLKIDHLIKFCLFLQLGK